MDPLVERKFKNLRRRLDQLGYRQPLGIETVPLVERLFSDLVHTTESLKNIKSQLAEKRSEGSAVVEQVEPYKADNAKLVKEVNQLHMELVRRKDAADAQVKKVRSTLRNVEHENADLKFLNTQYAHKLRVQEQDSELKSERIQRLLEKNLEAVVETVDGKRQHIATRRQRMELRSLVDPADPRDIPQSRHRATASAVGHHQADLLQLADTKIAELENQLATMQEDKVFIDSQLLTLQAQVQRREDEIERMGRLLEGGRPVSSVLADGHMKSDERKLATLETQVEYLQESKKALEAELATVGASNEELSLHVEEMQSKNATMIRELADFDRLSRELQQEKLAAKAESQRELRKEKSALERQKESFTERMGSLKSMEHAKVRLEGENEHLAAGLSKAEREVEKLQSEMNRAVDDRGRLEARCQRLVQREKELVAQLRLSGRDPATSIQTAFAPGGVSSIPFSGAAKSGGGGNDASMVAAGASRTIAGLKNEVKVLEDSNRSLQQVFISVEQERDYFKHEASKASSLGRSGGSGGGRRSDAARSAEPKAQEIQRYQAESRQLAEVVKRLEFQLNDASTELAWLRVEHDKVRLLYQQAATKLAAAESRNKLGGGGSGGDGGRSPSRGSPARGALAQGRPTYAGSSGFQQQQQHDEQQQQQQLQHEHNQVLLRAALADREAMEGTIVRISAEAEQLRARLAHSEREGAAAATKAGHLEALMLASMASGTPPQPHGSVGGGGSSIGGGGGGSGNVVVGTASPAAAHAERAIADLTAELDVMRARCAAAEGEAEKLRRALQSLHTDRDSLVAEADQQSVTINQLEQQLQARDADSAHGGAALRAAQEDISGLQSRIHEQQQDFAQLEQRCADLTHERDEVRANAEGLDSAIQGAHLDLDNMTREHQAVHAEYHRAVTERTEMERDLENAKARNDAVEKMLEEKSKDNDGLRSSFERINAEATTFQSQASAADHEASGAIQRLDLQTSEIDQLRRQLMEASATRLEAVKMRDELEAKNTAQSVEITQLQEMVARGDGGSRATDPAGGSGAASAVVQATLQVAADDAKVVVQLAELLAQNEQLQANLRAKEAAIDATARQSDAESSKALELEDLLSESRSGQAKADMQAQKLSAENIALRRTVQDMTEKAGALLRQVNELREAKTRGDEVASTLRHELANQRYEVTLAAHQGAAAGGGGGVGGGGEVGNGRNSLSGDRADSPPSRGDHYG